MSRSILGQADYPVRFKNVDATTVPAFGLMECTGAVIVGENLVLEMEQPTAASGEALFVNGTHTVAQNAYGTCRSIFDGPFWVAYDAAATPAAGDEWGPEANNFEAVTAGTGLKVLYKHASLEIMLCAALGGGGSCLTVHEIKIEGIATAGTFDLDVEIDDGVSPSTETLTLNWNSTAAQAKTEFETHADIASGDIAVRGGPLPTAALYIVYLTTGNLNRHQEVPVPDDGSGLTGTNPTPKATQVTSVNWEP